MFIDQQIVCSETLQMLRNVFSRYGIGNFKSNTIRRVLNKST